MGLALLADTGSDLCSDVKPAKAQYAASLSTMIPLLARLVGDRRTFCISFDCRKEVPLQKVT